MKVLRKQNNSNECIVCGKNSSASIGVDFYDVEGEIVVGVFTPKDIHQSYRNRMHGGMITAVLDETIGRAVQFGDKDIWGVTMDISVKFRKPVPLNSKLLVVGKIVKETSIGFTGVGFIEDEEGKLLASATARYVKLPPEKIAEGGMKDEEWFLTSDNILEDIEIKNLDFFNE